MNYKRKYLKYKNKYLILKNQIGGEQTELQLKYIDIPLVNECLTEGYNQHNGECWNDSIQHFFTFQDGIKDNVQKKLLNLSTTEIIYLAEDNNRKIYLPNIYKIDDTKYKQLVSDLIEYLDIFKERFQLYYTTEVIEKIRNRERKLKKEESFKMGCNY